MPAGPHCQTTGIRTMAFFHTHKKSFPGKISQFKTHANSTWPCAPFAPRLEPGGSPSAVPPAGATASWAGSVTGTRAEALRPDLGVAASRAAEITDPARSEKPSGRQTPCQGRRGRCRYRLRGGRPTVKQSKGGVNAGAGAAAAPRGRVTGCLGPLRHQ